MRSIIHNELNEHLKITNDTINSVSDLVEKAAITCIHSLKKGNKILLCGNGGSAADAQHIAAEIVGRYKTERKALSAIALTTDSSILTAVGNDFGFQYLFERQVEALAKHGDILIGISTGGSSKNVINALHSAKKIGCKLIGLSGKDGGDFNSICDVNIVIPSSNTPRIQEMHILVGHIVCQLIDEAFNS